MCTLDYEMSLEAPGSAAGGLGHSWGKPSHSVGKAVCST
jgi:hypothetical protein